MTDITATLARCPLLLGFPPEGIKQIARLCRVNTFREGEQIYAKGVSAKALTVVGSGSVRVCSLNSAGKELTLTICGPGNWFGDAVFCAEAPRLWGAIAHEDCQTLELADAPFKAVMAAYPQCYPVMLDQVAGRLCAAITSLEEGSLLSLPARVGWRLLMLASYLTGDQRDSRTVRLKLTREQLGNTLGITRQAVQKAMQGFEQAGLVRLDYGTITLTNPQALAQFLDTLD